MQQGTALPDVGRPVEHFRNRADGVRRRAHAAEIIDTAHSMSPAAKPLVLVAGEKGFISLLRLRSSHGSPISRWTGRLGLGSELTKVVLQ
jgi:hypothetical protein